MQLESGTEVLINPDAELKIHPAHRLVLESDTDVVIFGTLDARGTIVRHSGSRIIMQPGGRMITDKGMTVAFKRMEIQVESK
jgi:hypothetical protein